MGYINLVLPIAEIAVKNLNENYFYKIINHQTIYSKSVSKGREERVLNSED